MVSISHVNNKLGMIMESSEDSTSSEEYVDVVDKLIRTKYKLLQLYVIKQTKVVKLVDVFHYRARIAAKKLSLTFLEKKNDQQLNRLFKKDKRKYVLEYIKCCGKYIKQYKHWCKKNNVIEDYNETVVVENNNVNDDENDVHDIVNENDNSINDDHIEIDDEEVVNDKHEHNDDHTVGVKTRRMNNIECGEYSLKGKSFLDYIDKITNINNPIVSIVKDFKADLYDCQIREIIRTIGRLNHIQAL